MFNILVVEDDPSSRKLMEAVLLQNGFNPILAADGLEALSIMDKKHVDLVALDIMMPRMDGKEGYEDKHRGFLVGTDDYLVKPVNGDEMIWRINALLRRSKIVSERRLVIGETVFDYEELSVSWSGVTETLPQKEFMLAYKLLAYPNKIFTRIKLMDEIWGLDTDTDDHTVDVHISRLRSRFRDNPDFEIATIRGLGYKAVIKNET
jgi:DNA-binding response OmpR family regulator